MGGGGIIDGAIVNVEDFSQDLELQIVVEHVDEDSFDEEKNPLKFVINGGGSSSVATKPKKRARSEGDENDRHQNGTEKSKRVCLGEKSITEEEKELKMDDDGAIVMFDEDDDENVAVDGAIEIL